MNEKEAKIVWNNGQIPVVLRRGAAQPIRLRIRLAADNETWLRNGPRKRIPKWSFQGKYWELPASRFDEVVRMILDRFKKLYIIQPYREKEVCAPACQNASGFECQCSCMGANHGAANSRGWYTVSDSFAVRYGENKLACRLLIKTENDPN